MELTHLIPRLTFLLSLSYISLFCSIKEKKTINNSIKCSRGGLQKLQREKGYIDELKISTVCKIILHTPISCSRASRVVVARLEGAWQHIFPRSGSEFIALLKILVGCRACSRL
uniref:Uncharacterized protein n=1 Tax=Micrurus paraensis TaxID=1970185 RepID=A0A2D4L2T1_9SAUR